MRNSKSASDNKRICQQSLACEYRMRMSNIMSTRLPLGWHNTRYQSGRARPPPNTPHRCFDLGGPEQQ